MSGRCSRMLQEYLRDTHMHNIDLGEQGRETSGRVPEGNSDKDKLELFLDTHTHNKVKIVLNLGDSM